MASSLYTLSALDSATLSRLEDNSIFFQTAERYTIINEAIKCVNLLTGFYQGTLLTISQEGQLVYPTPVGMLYPQRIEFDGVQLDPIPITRIGQDYRTWTTDTTAKLGAVARWVPIGINYFCLHPADSNGGSSIAVTGVLEPPVLILPTDAMSLPDEFASIIVEYCASRLPLKAGGSSATAASQLYTKSFQPAIKPLLNLQKFSFPKYFVQAGSPTTEGKIA
jgi:Tfp pilus assembly protein PilZ